MSESGEYRALVYRIAKRLREQDRRDLCYLHDLPESCQKSGPNSCYLEPFQELERKGMFSPSNLAGLRKVLEQIERHDLIEEVNEYRPRTGAQVTASGALTAVSEIGRSCKRAETQNNIIASHVVRLREDLQRGVPVSDLEERVQELEMAVDHQKVLLSYNVEGCAEVVRCLRCELSTRAPLALPAPSDSVVRPIGIGSSPLGHSCTKQDLSVSRSEESRCDNHHSDGIAPPTSSPKTVNKPHKLGHCKTRKSGDSCDTAAEGECSPRHAGRRPPKQTHVDSSLDSRYIKKRQVCCGRLCKKSHKSEHVKAEQGLCAEMKETRLKSRIPKPLSRCATPPQRKGRIPPPHHVAKEPHQSLPETTSDYYSESDVTGGSEYTGSCSSGSKEGGIHAWRSHKLSDSSDCQIRPKESESRTGQYTTLCPGTMNRSRHDSYQGIDIRRKS